MVGCRNHLSKRANRLSGGNRLTGLLSASHCDLVKSEICKQTKLDVRLTHLGDAAKTGGCYRSISQLVLEKNKSWKFKMFKKLIFLAVTLLFSSTSYGKPMLYTFTGTVTSGWDDAGIVQNTYGTSDLTGNPVEYLVLIDPTANATVTYNDGTIETWDDIPANLGLGFTVDHFFADFVSGSLIDEEVGGAKNAPDDAAEFNVGASLDYADSTPDSSSLLLESDDEVTQFSTQGLFADWIIGQRFFGSERAFGPSDGFWSEIQSDLVLTDISSAVSPVPIPAAVWLFGTALIGLVGFSKRRKAA